MKVNDLGDREVCLAEILWMMLRTVLLCTNYVALESEVGY